MSNSPEYRVRQVSDHLVPKEYADLVGGEKWRRVTQEIATVTAGILKANGIPVVVDGDVHATVHFHDARSGACADCRRIAGDELGHNNA